MNSIIVHFHYLYPNTPLAVPIFIIAVLLLWLGPKVYTLAKKLFGLITKAAILGRYLFDRLWHGDIYPPENPLEDDLTVSSEDVKSWRRDYAKAGVFAVLGLIWLGACLLLYMRTLHLYYAALAMLCVAPFYRGLTCFEHGQSRKRQIALRQRYAAAIDFLEQPADDAPEPLRKQA